MKEIFAMRTAPSPISIILRCIQIGVVTGAVCGASFGFLIALQAALYGLLYGLVIGLVLGLAFGIVNGLALALLMTRLSPQTTDPRSLRRAFLLTSIAVSLIASIVGYFQAFQIPDSWVLFLWHTLWWNLFIAGPLTVMSWFANGWLYRWYVRHISTAPGEAPYGVEVNL